MLQQGYFVPFRHELSLLHHEMKLLRVDCFDISVTYLHLIEQ